MPYIITDGTSYCHRTKTQAVELTTDIEQATKFRNEQTAQKLLDRSTRKLKGFKLVELPSRSAKAAAEKKEAAQEEKKTDAPKKSTKKPAAKRTGAARSRKKTPDAKDPETQVQEIQTADPARETSGHTADPDVNEAVSLPAAKAEAAPSDTAETQEAGTAPRKHRRTHRGGRRRKNAGSAGETAQAENAVPENGSPVVIPEAVVEISADTETADTASAVEIVTEDTAQGAEAEVQTDFVSTDAVPAVDEVIASADISAHAVPVIEETGKTAAVSEETAPAAEKVTAPDTVTADTEAAAETEKVTSSAPKYPTTFKRRKKNTAASWSIEAATSRVFGSVPDEESAQSKQDKAAAASAVRTEAAHDSAAIMSEPAAAPAASDTETVTEVSAVKAAVAAEKTLQQAEVSEAADKNDASALPEKASENRRRRSRRGNRRSEGHADEQRHETAPAVEIIEAAKEDRTAPASTDETTPEISAAAPEKPAAVQRSERRVSLGRTGNRTSYKAEQTDDTVHERRSERNRRGSALRGTKASHDSTSTASRRRLFTQQERNTVYNRSEGHCGICGRFIPLEEYTIDHIVPLSKGGTNDLDNLQACCGFCNKAKDDTQGDAFFDRIQRIYLYQAELRYPKKQFKKLKKAMENLEDED